MLVGVLGLDHEPTDDQFAVGLLDTSDVTVRFAPRLDDGCGCGNDGEAQLEVKDLVEEGQAERTTWLTGGLLELVVYVSVTLTQPPSLSRHEDDDQRSWLHRPVGALQQRLESLQQLNHVARPAAVQIADDDSDGTFCRSDQEGVPTLEVGHRMRSSENSRPR